ncbi:unnamed protein product, partial [Didymodactylos carnosus]
MTAVMRCNPITSHDENYDRVGVILEGVKIPVSKGLEKLDEKQQKKEWYNISTLGNIEELQRTASNTAGLLTLYYQHQIELIDTSEKIRGSNPFGTFMKETKEKFNVRPEEAREMAIVLAAEYLLEWMIDSLKSGKNENRFIRTKPLAEQLWLYVAKRDPIQQGFMKSASDSMGVSTDKLKIPVITTDQDGHKKKLQVQIRYLFGCVSMMDRYGEIYQYQIPKDRIDPELTDLATFDYVYIAQFPIDDDTVKIIKESRNLKEAKVTKEVKIKIKSTFDKTMQEVGAFYDGDDTDNSSYTGGGGGFMLTKETAQQIAKVLTEQKTFVGPGDLKETLKKSRDQIEYDIAVLREDIKDKQDKYETTTKASFEQISLQLDIAKEDLKKDNEQRYNKE